MGDAHIREVAYLLATVRGQAVRERQRLSERSRGKSGRSRSEPPTRNAPFETSDGAAQQMQEYSQYWKHAGNVPQA